MQYLHISGEGHHSSEELKANKLSPSGSSEHIYFDVLSCHPQRRGRTPRLFIVIVYLECIVAQPIASMEISAHSDVSNYNLPTSDIRIGLAFHFPHCERRPQRHPAI